jgi:hypothetical protein
MKSVIALFALFAAAAVAQDASAAPECIQKCLAEVKPCGETATPECLCNTETQLKLAPCAIKECSPEDLAKGQEVSKTQCANVGAANPVTSAEAGLAAPTDAATEVATTVAETGAPVSAPAATETAVETAPAEAAPTMEESVAPSTMETAVATPASNETAVTGTEPPAPTGSSSASRFAVAGSAIFAAVLALAL